MGKRFLCFKDLCVEIQHGDDGNKRKIFGYLRAGLIIFDRLPGEDVNFDRLGGAARFTIGPGTIGQVA